MGDSLSVLVTTSGIGSRLGNFTKYSNKCLVRIGDKPAITRIIESYPEDTNFYITLGHNGDIVKQYLNVAHSNLKLTFINVDKYVGNGSSLGYSLLCAMPLLQKPFIFHACDTLIDREVPPPVTNWCGGYKKINSSFYSTLNIEGDKVKKINPKGEINYDLEYIGISGIKDYRLFWDTLATLYSKSPNNSHLNDCDCIREMIKDVAFNVVRFPVWNDIGNIDSLVKSKQFYGSKYTVLDKDKESIYFFDNRVIKFFSDSDINKKRVERVKHLNNLVPRILNSTKNFYCYEHIAGNLASDFINDKNIQDLMNWAKTNLWVNKTQSPENLIKCRRFYIDKTIKRVEMLSKQIGKPDGVDKINGLNVPSVFDMLSSIKGEDLFSEEFYNFHGDFILENIIITKDSFKLIDWRQDFAGCVDVGDIYYDLSKLNHNLFFNHENIDNGLYSITEEFEAISTDMKINYRLFLAKQQFDSWCMDNNFDLKKINMLTAIIWINMAPLHEYPLNKFLFYFGKYNLFKELEP